MFELSVVVLEFPEMHLQPHSPRWNEVEAMENHSWGIKKSYFLREKKHIKLKQWKISLKTNR